MLFELIYFEQEFGLNFVWQYFYYLHIYFNQYKIENNNLNISVQVLMNIDVKLNQ
jgi:hypothetical protein